MYIRATLKQGIQSKVEVPIVDDVVMYTYNTDCISIAILGEGEDASKANYRIIPYL